MYHAVILYWRFIFIDELNLPTNFILAWFPTTETGLIAISPKDDITESVDKVISLKVSPSETKVGTPFNIHSFPPFILVVIVHSKEVPSLLNKICDDLTQVIE